MKLDSMNLSRTSLYPHCRARGMAHKRRCTTALVVVPKNRCQNCLIFSSLAMVVYLRYIVSVRATSRALLVLTLSVEE